MKKVIFATVIAFSVIFAGCSNDQQKRSVPTEVTVTADTTIMFPQWRVVTAPRWSCSGKRLPQDKLLMFDSSNKPVKISLTRTKTVLTDCAVIVSEGRGGTTGTSWFWELLKWLLALIAMGATAYFLWWLFSQRPASRASAAAASPTSAPHTPAKTGATAEEITAVTGLVTAVSNGGGGTVRFSGLDLQINGVEAPLVYVKNSGPSSHSGNITVHIGDRSSEDDRRIVHEAPAAEKKES